MAIPTWPKSGDGTPPQRMWLAGGEVPEIRSPQSVGFQPDDPSITRQVRVATASKRRIELPIRIMREAQVDSLWSFWETTLAGGTLRFEWGSGVGNTTDPWPGSGTLSFLMPSPPQWSWRLPALTAAEWAAKMPGDPAPGAGESDTQRGAMVSLVLIWQPWWPASTGS